MLLAWVLFRLYIYAKTCAQSWVHHFVTKERCFLVNLLVKKLTGLSETHLTIVWFGAPEVCILLFLFHSDVTIIIGPAICWISMAEVISVFVVFAVKHKANIRSCSKSMLSEHHMTGTVQIGWTLLVQKQENPLKHYILYQVLSH